MKKVIFITLPFIGMVILGYLFYDGYMSKQVIQWEAVGAIEAMDITKEVIPQITADGIKVEVTDEQLNGIVQNYFQQSKKEKDELEQIRDLYYDGTSKKLYVATEKEKYSYTFKMDSLIKVEDNSIIFELEKGKVGTWGIPVSTKYYENKIGNSDRIEIGCKVEEDMLWLEEIEVGEDWHTVVYGYNEALLLSQFEHYKATLNETSTLLYKEQEMHPTIQQFIEGEPTVELAKKTLELFIEDQAKYIEFGVLLSEEGRTELYNQWGSFFNQGITLEQWNVLAQEFVFKGVNYYHTQFVDAFYGYLYKNAHYRFETSALTLNQYPIQAEQIWGEWGQAPISYPIEMVVEGNAVYATYQVDNTSIKKHLFSRRQ